MKIKCDNCNKKFENEYPHLGGFDICNKCWVEDPKKCFEIADKAYRDSDRKILELELSTEFDDYGRNRQDQGLLTDYEERLLESDD